MNHPAFSGEPRSRPFQKRSTESPAKTVESRGRAAAFARRLRERRVDGGKRLGARAPDIARTSIWALLRGARLASAFKMNPGEGFLIPAGFSELPMACFFAGGCGGGGGR